MCPPQESWWVVMTAQCTAHAQLSCMGGGWMGGGWIDWCALPRKGGGGESGVPSSPGGMDGGIGNTPSNMIATIDFCQKKAS